MALIFTAEEHERIDAAIRAVEQRTAADLDLVVTRVSDRYSLYPILWAGLLALTAEGTLALLWPAWPVRRAVTAQLAMLAVLALSFQWMPIRLALVPKAVKFAHARQLAHREFTAHGVSRNSHGRILLFVSLGERYVEVIADRETHASAPEENWNRIVAGFLQRVEGGKLADGVLDAVEVCAAVLEQHHPAAQVK